MAKKSGKPQEDFPSKTFDDNWEIDIEKGQLVVKSNVTRFTMCIDKRAFYSVMKASTSNGNGK